MGLYFTLTSWYSFDSPSRSFNQAEVHRWNDCCDLRVAVPFEMILACRNCREWLVFSQGSHMARIPMLPGCTFWVGRICHPGEGGQLGCHGTRGYRDIMFYWKYFLCTDLRVFPKVNEPRPEWHRKSPRSTPLANISPSVSTHFPHGCTLSDVRCSRSFRRSPPICGGRWWTSKRPLAAHPIEAGEAEVKG